MEPMKVTNERLPAGNLLAYSALYEIEVVLRELIIDRAQKRYGMSWWKRALPGGSIQEKYRDAVRYHAKTPWVRHTPHHPIYFVDYPELVTVIERSDNWNALFAETFQRRDLFVASLRQIEPIRNAVAHNRKVAAADADTVESLRLQISDTLGHATFDALVHRCTFVQDLPTRLRELKAEALLGHAQCLKCAELPQLTRWSACSVDWWFDDDYLGMDLTPLRTLFESLVAYAGLERGRGCGPRLEQWVRARGLGRQLAPALETFGYLLKEEDA